MYSSNKALGDHVPKSKKDENAMLRTALDFMVVDCKMRVFKGVLLYTSVIRHHFWVNIVECDCVCRCEPPSMELEFHIYYAMMEHCTGHIL